MAKHRTECSSQTETTLSLNAESCYGLCPYQNDCHISINHRFNLQESLTSVHLASFEAEDKATMCFSCEDYEGHYVGHYHHAGKKVIRRHNGRLVTERLRRPLLHFNDGTDHVGYRNRLRVECDDLRRRSRSCPVRLPMRVPGNGHMSWDGDGDRYCWGAMMRDRGCGRHAMFGGMRHGGFGHWHDHDHSFHGFQPQSSQGHMMHEQHGPHYHQRNNHGHYTTNDGIRGRVENRVPGNIS
jgi:hypothetical protein